jgi:hypothetical protein
MAKRWFSSKILPRSWLDRDMYKHNERDRLIFMGTKLYYKDQYDVMEYDLHMNRICRSNINGPLFRRMYTKLEGEEYEKTKYLIEYLLFF